MEAMSGDDGKLPRVRPIHKPDAKEPSSDMTWRRGQPETRVIPPVVTTLDSLSDTAQVLADQMATLAKVAQADEAPSIAKTLLTLAQTVATVQNARKTARENEDELDAMDEESLDKALEEAIETRRRKRLGLPETNEG